MCLQLDRPHRLSGRHKAELGVGALIEIRSEIVSLGNKSFVHRHEMYNRGTGELAATMENVTVAFDLNERKAVPIWEDFRARAEEMLKDQSAS